MKFWLTRIAALLLTACVLTQLAAAGSIWEKGNRNTRMQPSDDVARDVGDVLTIVINERSVMENKTDRNNEKKTSNEVDVAGGKIDTGGVETPNHKGTALVSGVGKNVLDLPQASFSSASDAKFQGTADYGTDRSMKDFITVTVEDVMPNGNLVVVGKRSREVAGDKQVIEISGIVRPSDIKFDNSVESERIANFKIVHKTSGQDTSYTRPGWLTKFANIISPF